MSTVAIVLIVVGALLLILFLGGFVGARRRANRPEAAEHRRAADRALEQARASDRGWDRELLEGAARAALEQQRPGSSWDTVELVLVDDRPGKADDAAHLRGQGPDGTALVVLARDEGGDWYAERVE
jgi:type II secretory pathway pseudopilin PulG